MLYTEMGKSAPSRAHELPYHIHDSRKIKVGLMGGSFNPPHKGHYKVAKLALVSLNLDEVWWLVSPQNPFKSLKNMLPLSKRVELTKEIALHPKFKVLTIESLFNTTNTYSLLNKMLPRFPNIKFLWIMGSDNLFELHKWHKVNFISHLLPIAVFNRPSFSHRALNSKGAFILRNKIKDCNLKNLVTKKPPVWGYINNININFSSTFIREANH